MPNNKESNEDYARVRVPENETVSGYNIATLIIGIGVTLPTFYVGGEVAQSIGFSSSIWLFILVNLVLGILCTVTALIGNRTRLSTYMLLHFSFGRKGSAFINFLIGITLLGWYAVTVEIFGTVLTDAIKYLLAVDFPNWLSISLGSVLMTLTAIYGFKVMEKFSLFAVPLMVGFLVYVLYVATGISPFDDLIEIEGNHKLSFLDSISAIVGLSILTPVLMPDFSRFARTDKDSLIAVLGLIIGFPIILFAGAIPSLITGENDIMKVMIKLQLSLPAFIILIFSTWTTNTTNLYSTQLTLSTVFKNHKMILLGIIASIFGTLLAVIGITSYFIELLKILSVLIPPISAIFIADYFFIKRQYYDLKKIDSLPEYDFIALLSWLISCTIAFLAEHDFLYITSVSFFDSFIVGFILYLVLKKFQHRTTNMQRH